MTWHYLPVWRDNDEPWSSGRTYSLCEVYVDDEGRLDGWTEDPEMAPIGDDMADLCQGLEHMLNDARRWEPVKFSDLAKGMVFKRRGESNG